MIASKAPSVLNADHGKRKINKIKVYMTIEPFKQSNSPSPSENENENKNEIDYTIINDDTTSEQIKFLRLKEETKRAATTSSPATKVNNKPHEAFNTVDLNKPKQDTGLIKKKRSIVLESHQNGEIAVEHTLDTTVDSNHSTSSPIIPHSSAFSSRSYDSRKYNLSSPSVSFKSIPNDKSKSESVVGTPKFYLKSKTTPLYVGDLASTITESILYKTFSKFGEISSIKVCRDTSGKSLGYGYVNFVNIEESKIATRELNYTPIMGKECRIMPSMKNFKEIGVNLLVSNLPSNFTTRAFYELFSNFGTILSTKIISSKDTNTSKGIGFVHFEDALSAEKAINELNDKIINGKQLSIIEKQSRPLKETPAPVPENETNYRTLFVKNLPINVNQSEVRHLFAKYGTIYSVNVSPAPEMKASWAFVTFINHSDAVRAVEILNKYLVNGKTIIVSRALSKEERQNEDLKIPDNRRSLYIQNLSPYINEEFINVLFSQYGQVSKVKILKDEKGVARGIAFVEMPNRKELESAVNNLNGYMINEKAISVKPSFLDSRSTPDSKRSINEVSRTPLKYRPGSDFKIPPPSFFNSSNMNPDVNYNYDYKPEFDKRYQNNNTTGYSKTPSSYLNRQTQQIPSMEDLHVQKLPAYQNQNNYDRYQYNRLPQFQYQNHTNSCVYPVGQQGGYPANYYQQSLPYNYNDQNRQSQYDIPTGFEPFGRNDGMNMNMNMNMRYSKSQTNAISKYEQKQKKEYYKYSTEGLIELIKSRGEYRRISSKSSRRIAKYIIVNFWEDRLVDLMSAMKDGYGFLMLQAQIKEAIGRLDIRI